MKKIFALAMAAAMIASMAAISFAATPDSIYVKDGGFEIKDDKDGKFYPVVDAFGPFSYDADEKMLSTDLPEYGDTAYYALLQNVDGTAAASIGPGASMQLITKSEVVSSLKVKTKWEEGSSMVKSVSIVKKKISNEATAYTNSDGDVFPASGAAGLNIDQFGYSEGEYYYFLAIAIQDSTSTSDTDIIGTLTLNKSKTPKVKDLELDVSMTVNWANSYQNNPTDYELDGDSPELKAEKYYALKFKADDEIDLNFEDGSIFTVDVSGQSKVLMYYDTNFNSKIAAKYPLAELNFWNGNGAKFNRVGEMFLACKEDYSQFLYQVNADGTLSEVAGAEFDKYDEGFYFNTRVLGTYVISDMELDIAPAVTTPSVETPVVTTPAPVVTNPSTGAAA